jgi:hypothetical protein
VKRRETTRPIPLHDYGQALQTAVSWLGDRYLLAEPVNRRREEASRYFNVPHSWYSASRISRQVRH